MTVVSHSQTTSSSDELIHGGHGNSLVTVNTSVSRLNVFAVYRPTRS